MNQYIKSPEQFLKSLFYGSLFLLILCTGSNTLAQQDSSDITHTVGLSLFKLEQNSVTLNEKLEPKLYTGIQYEMGISSFGLNFDLEYGVNTINDKCRNCSDVYYGKGHLSEVNFILGVKYSFFMSRNYRFTPYIEANGYGSRMIYWGDFDGGFYGTGIETNSLYYAVGGLFQVGVDIRLAKGFNCMMAFSGRMGTAWKSNNYHIILEPTFSRTYDTAITPVHLGISYTF